MRFLEETKPKFFIMENVRGLLSLYKKEFFKMILNDLKKAGYNVFWKLVNAKDYGVPQDRLRVFIVGVREDLTIQYNFPKITHGPNRTNITVRQNIKGKIDFVYDNQDIQWSLKKHVSLRETIGHLKPPKDNEYYNSPKYSFFYMSRNRRRTWDQVSYTIQASGRHIPIHPSCPPMKRVGKDKFIFTGKIS